MDQRAIDIVVTDSDGAVKAQSVRKNSMWKKINEKLQDNRLSGRRDADKILDCENPEKYKCLKRVLNIAFLSIGVTLLISVVAVIIYSAIGGPAMTDAKLMYICKIDYERHPDLCIISTTGREIFYFNACRSSELFLEDGFSTQEIRGKKTSAGVMNPMLNNA